MLQEGRDLWDDIVIINDSEILIVVVSPDESLGSAIDDPWLSKGVDAVDRELIEELRCHDG